MTKKRISVLLVFAMIFTMLFAGTAMAASPPYTTFTSGFTNVTVGNNKSGGTITAVEREDDSWTGDIYVTVELPEGVTYNATPTSGTLTDYVTVTNGTGTLDAASKSMLRVKVAPDSGTVKTSAQFKFNEDAKSRLDIASSVAGDVRAGISVMQVVGGAVGWMESDTRTIARVAARAVTVSAAAPTVVQMGGNRPAAKMTLQEGAPGSLTTSDAVYMEIVTSGVKFNTGPTVAASGGGLAVSGQGLSSDSKIAWFKVSTATSIFTGKVEITSALDIDPTATGDIKVRIRSTDANTAITTTTLTVATLGTAQVEIADVLKNTGTIYAGHPAKVIGTSSAAADSARFSFKASSGSTLPKERIVVLELSGGVKFVNNFVVETRTTSTGTWTTQSPTINYYGSDTKAWFETGDWGAVEMRLRAFELLAPGDTAAGDIKVTVAGNFGASGDVVLGKVAKPFSANAEIKRLAYPGLNQAAGDIVITEAARGTLLVEGLTLELPHGVSFTSKPRVRVTSGDLKIDSGYSISSDGKYLYIDVTTVSTEASVITIDRISYDVSRAAMEGNVNVKVYWEDDEVVTTVANARVGTVAGATVFTIGSMTYTVDGKSLAMDVAPVIKNGRTLLPLRFAAEAAGADEVMWDAVRKAVTLIRGDRVVQVTIGSTSMLINGAVVTMDVAPEIIDGRTMLPIRWVGVALRANVEWNADARAVTVTPY